MKSNRRVVSGAVLAVAVLASCSSSNSPVDGVDVKDSAGTTSAVTGSSTVAELDDHGDRSGDCVTSDCAAARVVVAELIEVWWFGEPATLKDLADSAESLVTERFRSDLVEGGDVSIRKLDPAVHVVTGSTAEQLDGNLVVVVVEHRDVGTGVATSVSLFDVVDVDGRWKVDQVVTR